MVFLIWSVRLPRAALPQKSTRNVSTLNAIATHRMNSTSGTILAVVTTTLRKAADLTPRSTR